MASLLDRSRVKKRGFAAAYLESVEEAVDAEPVEPLALVAELESRIEQYESRIEQYELEVGSLVRESETLNEALESRTVIGRATGLLAAGLKLPMDDAWDVIRRTSSYANVKLRDVARLLVLAHDGAPAPGEAQVAARIALALERATRQSVGDPLGSSPLSPSPPPS